MTTTSFNNRAYISNDVNAINLDRLKTVVPITLPLLDRVWTYIEQATGYKWINTSFIRNSPSHKLGHAIDLIPDMEPEMKAAYSGTNHSDPIWHSRLELYNNLLPIIDNYMPPGYAVLVAVESDHLHVQIVPRGRYGPHPIEILRWQTLKPVYSDTVARNSITAGLRDGRVY